MYAITLVGLATPHTCTWTEVLETNPPSCYNC